MVTKENCRILVLGESCVGKTCLIHRFIDKKLNIEDKDKQIDRFHYKTLGFNEEAITIPLENGNIIKAKICDTAGQERYRSAN